jgi:hypothetical protein
MQKVNVHYTHTLICKRKEERDVWDQDSLSLLAILQELQLGLHDLMPTDGTTKRLKAWIKAHHTMMHVYLMIKQIFLMASPNHHWNYSLSALSFSDESSQKVSE